MHCKIFLISLALLLVVITANCQTKMTEGRIVYTITIVDSNAEESSEKIHIFPLNYYFKNNKQRLEVAFGPKDSITTLYDQKTNIETELEIEDSKKTAWNSTYNDQDTAIEKQIKSSLKYSDKTKVICGYKCKKIEYLVPGDSTTFYVYYTKELTVHLSYNFFGYFAYLDGFPMEFNMQIYHNYAIFKCSEVSFKTMDDNLFKIPKGYKIENLDKKKK